MSRLQQFIDKFYELMKEYDAEIGLYGDDYDTCLEIEVDKETCDLGTYTCRELIYKKTTMCRDELLKIRKEMVKNE